MGTSDAAVSILREDAPFRFHPEHPRFKRPTPSPKCFSLEIQVSRTNEPLMITKTLVLLKARREMIIGMM